jgi:hypothetical protein
MGECRYRGTHVLQGCRKEDFYVDDARRLIHLARDRITIGKDER